LKCPLLPQAAWCKRLRSNDDANRPHSVDPAIRFGKPCLRGTRITVGEALGILASGHSEAELLADFLQLTHEDILACLGFAAERERRLLVLPAA
jgi:uncharacterized protein (DUF433 family)